MPRKSFFNLEQYVSDKSGEYLILRLKDLDVDELEGKPYKTTPIIHDGKLKKYVIYADAETFSSINKTKGKSIGNAFVKLFSRKVNEQKKARETIINFYRERLNEIRQNEFRPLLESMKVDTIDTDVVFDGLFIDDGYAFEEAN